MKRRTVNTIVYDNDKEYDGDRMLLTTNEFLTLYRCMKEALQDAG